MLRPQLRLCRMAWVRGEGRESNKATNIYEIGHNNMKRTNLHTCTHDCTRMETTKYNGYNRCYRKFKKMLIQTRTQTCRTPSSALNLLGPGPTCSGGSAVATRFSESGVAPLRRQNVLSHDHVPCTSSTMRHMLHVRVPE